MPSPFCPWHEAQPTRKSLRPSSMSSVSLWAFWAWAGANTV